MTAVKSANSHPAVAPEWRPKNEQVSSRSHYADEYWELDYRTMGQRAKQGRVDWRIPTGTGELLTAPRWSSLLNVLKCFVWTLFNDRREGRPLAEGSAGRITDALRDLVPWMIASGNVTFSTIDCKQSWAFVEWFRRSHEEIVIDHERQRKMTYASAWQVVHVLSLIHQQGPALRERGIAPMPEAPYDRRKAYDVVKADLRLRKGEKLSPIPDSIAIQILHIAARWVTEYSDDVLHLQALWLSAIGNASGVYERIKATRAVIDGFKFSIDAETGKPWTSIRTTTVRQDKDGVDRKIIPGIAARRLVSDLVAACVVVLQGLTGLRTSDLASIELKEDDQGPVPSCIKVQKSLDGLSDVFMLEATEQKESHEKHSWALGTRLTGTDLIPLPVRAVIVLRDLLSPYRKISGINSLILTMTNGRSLSLNPSNISRPISTWLSDIQRDFIKNWVGLQITTYSKRKEGGHAAERFRAQQWRRTFALFVVSTNKRALGPLARHFNHLDALMTEQGYIGNDPELLRMLDEARVTLAANLIYEVVMDSSAFAGNLTKQISENSEQLRKELLAKPPEDALSQVKAMVMDHDLRIHFTDYGACGIAIGKPALARCHELAGTKSADAVRPDFSMRTPSVCLSCHNFLVSYANLDYWRERVANLSALKGRLQEEQQWRHAKELALARQIVRTLEQATPVGSEQDGEA